MLAARTVRPCLASRRAPVARQNALVCKVRACAASQAAGHAASCKVPLLQGSRLESSRLSQAKQVAVQAGRPGSTPKQTFQAWPFLADVAPVWPDAWLQPEGCSCVSGCRRSRLVHAHIVHWRQASTKGLAWAVDRATAGKGALLTAAGVYAAIALAAGSADLALGQEVFDGNCACAPAAASWPWAPACWFKPGCLWIGTRGLSSGSRVEGDQHGL